MNQILFWIPELLWKCFSEKLIVLFTTMSPRSVCHTRGSLTQFYILKSLFSKRIQERIYSKTTQRLLIIFFASFTKNIVITYRVVREQWTQIKVSSKRFCPFVRLREVSFFLRCLRILKVACANLTEKVNSLITFLTQSMIFVYSSSAISKLTSWKILKDKT